MIRKVFNLQGLESVPDIEEILTHDLFKSMESFNHHGRVSCLEHTLMVAETALSMTEGKPGIDVISTVRGALLHDFYLYDWHTDSPGLHGFKHPYSALANAEKHFTLNKIERDAIKRHMWPLTPLPPRYRESFIVTVADKAVTWHDDKKVFSLKSIRQEGKLQQKAG